jgi:hypothetical protein
MTIYNAGGFFHLVSNWGPKAGFSATEGFHALSRDGVHWQVPERADAFSLRVEYADGSVTDFGDGGNLERVKVHAPGGTATHMYRAVAPEDKSGARPATGTWSMVTPLRRPLSVDIGTAGEGPARIDYLFGVVGEAVGGERLVGYERVAVERYTPGHEWINTQVDYFRSTRLLPPGQGTIMLSGSCPGV